MSEQRTLVIKTTNEPEPDGAVCQIIGCRNLVDRSEQGFRTQCRIHLNCQRERQAKYREKKKHKQILDKEKLEQFETLQLDYDNLVRELQESNQKAAMYDELKRRYDQLLIAFKTKRG